MKKVQLAERLARVRAALKGLEALDRQLAEQLREAAGCESFQSDGLAVHFAANRKFVVDTGRYDNLTCENREFFHTYDASAQRLEEAVLAGVVSRNFADSVLTVQEGPARVTVKCDGDHLADLPELVAMLAA